MVVVYAESPERCYASIRQVTPDPWDAQIFALGTIHRGVVDDIVDWGAAIQLRPGVYAMMLSPQKRYARGDEVDVELIDIDPVLRKLGVRAV